MPSFNKIFAALALLASAPAAAQDYPVLEDAPDRPQLALMGTVPIYWGEAADMDEVLRGEGHPHWARAVIERHLHPVPLDYLSEESLAPYEMLLMAQPRGLTAEENVALDSWVRAGGRLLLFADPMMTGESRFGIGDRRRPQDVALLSPILTHWGLELWLDEQQGEGLTHVDPDRDNIPVNMAGSWVVAETNEDCATMRDRLIVRCQLGDGEAMLVADAALLDLEGPHPGALEAFVKLMRRIFPEFGDHAGMRVPERRESSGNDGNSIRIALEASASGEARSGF